MGVSMQNLYGSKWGGDGPYVRYDGTLPVGKYTAGVVADAFYIGLVQNRIDPKKPPMHTIEVVFQLESRGPEGKRHLCGRKYSIAMGDRALLPRLFEALNVQFDFGAQYDSVEALAASLCDALKGKTCTITIKKGKARDKGGHWLNIDTVGPPLEGKEKLAVDDYARERDLGGAGGGSSGNTGAEGATGDDIPI